MTTLLPFLALYFVVVAITGAVTFFFRHARRAACWLLGGGIASAIVAFVSFGLLHDAELREARYWQKIGPGFSQITDRREALRQAQIMCDRPKRNMTVEAFEECNKPEMRALLGR